MSCWQTVETRTHKRRSLYHGPAGAHTHLQQPMKRRRMTCQQLQRTWSQRLSSKLGPRRARAGQRLARKQQQQRLQRLQARRALAHRQKRHKQTWTCSLQALRRPCMRTTHAPSPCSSMPRQCPSPRMRLQRSHPGQAAARRCCCMPGKASRVQSCARLCICTHLRRTPRSTPAAWRRPTSRLPRACQSQGVLP